jgi:transposase
MTTMTRKEESTATPSSLLLAFELGERTWKLGFTTGFGQRPRIRQVPAGALARVWAEIAAAKARFNLAVDTPVISCYEAGRDGFWIHRALVAQDVANQVVDSSSIEVNRRARRMKSDGLDVGGLLTLLARWVAGDQRCWRVVRVPAEQDEDARHRHRLWEAVQQDRTRLINRLQGLLVTAGVRVPVRGDFLTRIAAVRRWDDTPLPAGVRERLTRTWAQLAFLTTQLEELEAARTALAPDPQTPAGRAVTQLQTLRAIGPIGAWVLTTEIFGWRQIRNGRQLGALVGLVPALYQSGKTARDLGITRAGNKHVRRLMVQLAWSWLRYQPTSALAQWYQQRFGSGGPRARRIGIVALARKLLLALWRYVETGTVPEGAVLKG